jgi:chemotaxis protein MotA
MLVAGGFAFILFCVFGSYIVHGGKFGIIMTALPFEIWAIGGAATGAFLMSNSMHDVKHTLHGFSKIFKGAAFKKADYIDLLSLLYFFVRLASTKGAMALEAHIEKPADSPAFQKFPNILKNHHATAMVCDYLRMVGMNADDPNQIEDVMARELKKTMAEEMHGAHALQSVADALPALGIVAAVLGVIKTMGSIDQPPAILGGMIGSALVGTFLGVLLSYGIVGPLANRLRAVIDADAEIYLIIRRVIVGSMKGQPQPLVIEAARTAIDPHNQPTFAEVFDGMRTAK